MVTSNVAWLPIQSKQQGNKKRLGLEVRSDRIMGGVEGGGGRTKFEKAEQAI